MNKLALIVVVLLVVFGAGFGVGLKYEQMTARSLPPKRPPMTPIAQQPPHTQPPTNTPTMGEWQEFRAAREKTLQGNPDLAAEYQKIQDDMKKHEQAIETAMLKADPTVAPILAKLDWQRQQSMAAASAAAKPVTQPKPAQ